MHDGEARTNVSVEGRGQSPRAFPGPYNILIGISLSLSSLERYLSLSSFLMLTPSQTFFVRFPETTELRQSLTLTKGRGCIHMWVYGLWVGEWGGGYEGPHDKVPLDLPPTYIMYVALCPENERNYSSTFYLSGPQKMQRNQFFWAEK